MRIDLVTIAYNSGFAVDELIESARSQKGHRVGVRLFLHSSHAPTVAVCEEIARAPDVQYYPFRYNRGVSRSWNDGILEAYADGADIVIVANDDIRFSNGDLDRLAEKAARCAGRYIVTCAGPHGHYSRTLPSHGYACFAINPIALAAVGCFDENFSPHTVKIRTTRDEQAWLACPRRTALIRPFTMQEAPQSCATLL